MKSDLQILHERINNELPKEVMILPMANDESFLCEAKRSIPVGYKAIIHEKDFMLDWYKRLGKLYKVGLADGSCSQQVTDRAKTLPNAALPSSYGINYRVLNTELTDYDSVYYGPIVFRQGVYLLTKVSQP